MFQMRFVLKKIIGYFLWQIRNLLHIFINFKEISVLCYHGIGNSDDPTSVDPAFFLRQINYLIKKQYHFATLNEIVEYIDNKIDLPPQTIAITFDDGYDSFLTQVLPILKLFKIPTTLFVITDFETGGHLGPNAQLLTPDQLKKVLDSRLVSLQFHSKTHPNFIKLGEEDLRNEIISGKNELENKLGVKLDYFAYPGGGYTGEAVEMVMAAGFKASFSIKPGLIYRGAYKFLIRRNVVLGDMSFWEFKLRLTKAIDWYRKMSLKFKSYE